MKEKKCEQQVYLIFAGQHIGRLKDFVNLKSVANITPLKRLKENA